MSVRTSLTRQYIAVATSSSPRVMCSEKLSVSSVPTLSRNPRNPVDPAAVPPSCTVPSGAWCRTDSRSRVTSSESGLAIAAMLRLLPTASPTPHSYRTLLGRHVLIAVKTIT